MRKLGLAALLLCAVGASVRPACAAGPVGTVAAPPGIVPIAPGTPIQNVVDAHPPGTAYLIQGGLHRLQQVVPKDGDRFIGAPGARLNGARLLIRPMRDGRFYVFDQQAPHPGARRHGVCQAGFPRCNRPQALFVDDKPLRAVDQLKDVAQGSWYFDEAAQRIYMADDPAGRTVELTHTPFAFGGTARNVRIENLIVEKYASANQHGAINDHGIGRSSTTRRGITTAKA